MWYDSNLDCQRLQRRLNYNLTTINKYINAELDKVQAEIKIARRNINNLSYADDTTLIAESEEKLKSLLVKVKEKMKKLT